MKKTLRNVLTLALLAVGTAAQAEVKTWEYAFNTNKSDGGQGFYQLQAGSPTTATTEINGLEWTIASETYAYAYTKANGQQIGTAKNPATTATLSTAGIEGKVTGVTISARCTDGCEANVSIRVNGTAYGEAQSLTKDVATYDFAPTGDAQQGLLEIVFNQTSETKKAMYLTAIAVTYDDGQGTTPTVVVGAPTISPKGGWSLSAKTVTITPADEADVIYYTLDGSSPKESATRVEYTAPFTLNKTTTVTAVAFRENTYSPEVAEEYVIMRDPDLHFEDYTPSFTATVGQEGVFVAAHNPYNLPLEFESSDTSVATVDNTGYVKALSVGQSEIAFYFEGNDEFFGGEGYYQLTVTEATAVDGLHMEVKQLPMYNLQGQRVAGLGKGIYVVNGKKVVKQ